MYPKLQKHFEYVITYANCDLYFSKIVSTDKALYLSENLSIMKSQIKSQMKNDPRSFISTVHIWFISYASIIMKSGYSCFVKWSGFWHIAKTYHLKILCKLYTY